MKSLKEISQIQTGVFAKPRGEGELVYLQVKHFDDRGELVEELHEDLFFNDISDKHLLKSGDVLFAAKGLKNFATVFESHNKPAVASTSFIVIKQKDHNLSPYFLKWYLNDEKILKKLKKSAKGSAIPSITLTILEDLEVPLPPLSVQELIVKINGLIDSEKKIRKKINDLKDKLILLKSKKIIDKHL